MTDVSAAASELQLAGPSAIGRWFAVLALVASGGGILSGAAETCYEAMLAQHFEAAFALCRPLAEQGEAIAQLDLGAMYFDGKGVPQDYAEAVKWYRKAAEQGAWAAQFQLGAMYDTGNGVPQDYAEAVKWYRKAATKGLWMRSSTSATCTPWERASRRTMRRP